MKEIEMTRLFKLFGSRLLVLGSARASTMGLGGLQEEDENRRFIA